jgi:sugar/nucleoside kinase (ribokinase family)
MRAGGFAQALAITHSAGGLTALDIGPAIGEPVRLAELQPLLPHVDYLLANTHELSILVDEPDWTITCNRLLDAGACAVVVKRGEQGASLWSQTVAVDIPAFAVKANISIGAGDAFNAGFLYGVRQGWSPEQALRFGNAVAALTVASDRGVLGSPGLAEVEAFLKSN